MAKYGNNTRPPTCAHPSWWPSGDTSKLHTEPTTSLPTSLAHDAQLQLDILNSPILIHNIFLPLQPSRSHSTVSMPLEAGTSSCECAMTITAK